MEIRYKKEDIGPDPNLITLLLKNLNTFCTRLCNESKDSFSASPSEDCLSLFSLISCPLWSDLYKCPINIQTLLLLSLSPEPVSHMIGCSHPPNKTHLCLFQEILAQHRNPQSLPLSHFLPCLLHESCLCKEEGGHVFPFRVAPIVLYNIQYIGLIS